MPFGRYLWEIHIFLTESFKVQRLVCLSFDYKNLFPLSFLLAQYVSLHKSMRLIKVKEISQDAQIFDSKKKEKRFFHLIVRLTTQMEMTFLNSGLYYSCTKKIFYDQSFMTQFIAFLSTKQLIVYIHFMNIQFKKKIYFIFVFIIDDIKTVSSTGVLYYFLVLFIDLAPETLMIRRIY